MTVIQGDCVEEMAGMDRDSIDAIVTDPPYGLEFMGKEWDRLWDQREARAKRAEYVGSDGSRRTKTTGFSAHAASPTYQGGMVAQQWHTRWATEALRVAKPGAYLLAFGGTRTVHRLTVALEDAGWVIRDLLVWAYAQGFPKSRSSLKPAWEPIVLARKPGPLRELGIDACRIGIDEAERAVIDNRSGADDGQRDGIYHDGLGYRAAGEKYKSSPAGRWPANVILTDPIFDGGWEGVVGGGEAGGGWGVRGRGGNVYGGGAGYTTEMPETGQTVGYGDSGTYSRFFYIGGDDECSRCGRVSRAEPRSSQSRPSGASARSRWFLIPKASRSDREPLVPGGVATLDGGVWGGDEDDLTPGKKRVVPRVNTHPTVKPTALMRHLIRLVTPEGGTVLDPFLGSGTTAKAAVLEGFDWVGIEREEEYVRIAEQRLVGLVPEPQQLEMTA